MARRLFLIDTNTKILFPELKDRGAEFSGVYNIIETFLQGETPENLIQLLSIFDVRNQSNVPTFTKANFIIPKDGFRLVKSGERESIEPEEYYSILLRIPNQTIEPKVRAVVKLGEVKYSFESNTERNYSVAQVDFPDHLSLTKEDLFDCIDSVDVLGELYMSLEETFARLHLEQKPINLLEDASAILIENAEKKVGSI